MIDQGTIQQAARLLQEAAPGAKIVLFGSHARNDAGPDSDLDFLVVEPAVTSRRAEMVRLRDVLRPLRIPVNVLVVSAQTFEKWSATPGTVLFAAAKEGVVVNVAE